VSFKRVRLNARSKYQLFTINGASDPERRFSVKQGDSERLAEIIQSQMH
jgi:hypothetical protein